MSRIPWSLLIVLCLTWGLAPFTPPHLWEKLQMLAYGTLSAGVDWLDLFLHGLPWLLLAVKGGVTLRQRSRRRGDPPPS